MNPVPHDTIARRAYELWEQAGRPSGRDQEFWVRAEAELAAQASASASPPVIPPPIPSPAAFSPTSPVHQVPPRIKDAVKTPGRRPTQTRRAPKRA